METLGWYLLKMTCWLAGFYLVYFLFLKKETFYLLNRWFLLLGIAAALLMPLYTFNYKVVKMMDIAPPPPPPTDYLTMIESATVHTFSVFDLLLIFYLLGILLLLTLSVIRYLNLKKLETNGEKIWVKNTEVIRVSNRITPFSFFNKIFIGSHIQRNSEIESVVAHEKVHIDERHWVDLLLFGTVRTLQWFNPLVLLYRKAVMQNHEYLADFGALNRGVNPFNYKALLVNEMLGYNAIGITSSFKSFNPSKRIEMMNKHIKNPKRKFRLLLVLPVFALILFAFSKPQYEFINNGNAIDEKLSIQDKINVAGEVTDERGDPLPGTTIISVNSEGRFSTATITDSNGKFILKGVSEDEELVFSFVGYATDKITAQETVKIKLKEEAYQIDLNNSTTNVKMEDRKDMPPPPPPPAINDSEIAQLLFIVDGEVRDINPKDLNPDEIESISVVKGEDEELIKKYGDKAKDGVIFIKTKKNSNIPTPASIEEEVFVIVEDMPTYSGGNEQLQKLQVTYFGKESLGSGETISFLVKGDGSISKVSSSLGSKSEAKVKNFITAMGNWKPGMQRGKNVAVRVELKL